MTIQIADWLDEATARFVASAPLLYGALWDVTDAYWGVNDDHAGDGGEPPTVIASARAALRKSDLTLVDGET